MRTRFFLSFILLLCLGLVIPLSVNWQELHIGVVGDMKESAKREVHLLGLEFIHLADTSENKGQVISFLNSLASKNLRISFIDTTGKVLYDSAVQNNNLESLENHSNRQEVKDALTYGKGSATRFSKTLDIDFVYAAEKVPATTLFPEGLLRIATPTAGVAGRLDGFVLRFFLAGAAILLAAFLLSNYLYTRLQSAIKDMEYVVNNTAVPDPSRRPALPPKPEFKELSLAVSSMTQRVNHQLRTIITQKVETDTILNSMDAGVLVLGNRGHIIRMNPAFYNLLPSVFTKDLENYSNKTPLEVFPNPDLQNAIDVFMASSDQTQNIQLPLCEKVFQINLTKPIKDSGLLPSIELVLIFHDITAISKLIEMKKDLIANVSHELRTPLTAIQGYAETLQSLSPNIQENQEKVHNFLNIIIKNTQHLNRIVQDLLSLSTLENDHSKQYQGHCEVHTAFASALEECAPQLEEKKLQLITDFEPNICVAIDSDRLSQVFRNLIENAIRYSEENAFIYIQGNTKDYLCQITIQDYGKGIPLEDVSRIFERFYRVEKHRGSASTGLGLSLCKHIVEKFGGSIRAQFKAPSLIKEQNHVGATLIFTVPLYTSPK